jgi:hypothetical protein
VEQGQDWTQSYTFASSDPSGLNQFDQIAYYDFAGCNVRMAVRQSFDATSAVLLSLSTSTSGLVLQSLQAPDGPPAPAFSNTVTVTVTAAQSLVMPAGEYWYDMFVDWPSGLHTRLMSGNFQVIQTVSGGTGDILYTVIVTNAMSPYTPALPNTAMLVDSSAGPVTILIPNLAFSTIGTQFEVDDYGMRSATNTITVTPPTGMQLEDPNNPGGYLASGVACQFVINGQFASWRWDGMTKFKLVSVGT